MYSHSAKNLISNLISWCQEALIWFIFFSHLFDACLKHSGIEMFFFHRGSNSVCAGQTLALCIPADFCQQSKHSPVVLTQTTLPDVFAPLTPAGHNLDLNSLVSLDRIQRTHLGGTRIPAAVTPAPSSSEEVNNGAKFLATFSGEESGLVRINQSLQHDRTWSARTCHLTK